VRGLRPVACLPARVRDARLADVPALAGLVAQLFAKETEFPIDAAAQERGLALLLARPGRAEVLVAEDPESGALLGMVSLQYNVSTAQGGLSALLEDLVVHESCRGCGLGSRLLDAAVERAAKSGATRLQLLTDHANQPALDFYTKHGFAMTRMVCLRKLSD
jgi:ribosomal protein S18 acetylase RimI-like enzyme